jgi:hypothetical protein
MTTPDPGAGLARLDALITPGLQPADTGSRAAVAGWGMMLTVVHQARGVRVLHAAGQCHAALPLLRSLTEYAMGAIWVADAGEDAVDVLNNRLQHSHGRLARDMAGPGGIDVEAAFPARLVTRFRSVLDAALSSHPDDRLTHFSSLLEEYGLGKMIPVYDVLSGFSHLSLSGAQAFSHDDLAGTTTLFLQPRKAEPVPCEVYCLGMYFDAMRAYNVLLEGRPWTEELASIAADHGITAPLPGRVRRSASGA